jgi:PAS domain S-box-containing protein
MTSSVARPRVLRHAGSYALAVLAVVLALLVRTQWAPWVFAMATYLPFFFAVVVAATVGGVGPGLVAVGLSAVATSYFLLEPHGSLWIASGNDRVQFACFVLIAASIGWLCAMVNRVHRRLRRERTRLLASEARFRSLANTAPAVIWTADPAGNITFHNQRWLEYTGIDAQANVADWPRLVLYPDDYARCVAAWTRALATGTEYEIEVRNRRHDGEYRWFLTRALPARDDQGRIVEWYGSTIDIHDAKLAAEIVQDSEARLRASEERFRRAAHATGAVVYEVDLVGTARASAHGLERLLGADGRERELSSAWWHTRIHPDDLPRHVAQLQECLGDPARAGYRVAYRVRHTDGTWRDVEDAGEVVRGADGRPVRLVGAILDVTERKRVQDDMVRLQAELVEADRKKDEFLSVLAHELRNPLAPIRNSLELMKLAHTDATAVAQARVVMERQLGQMVRLIDDLMDLTRISRGKIGLQRRRMLLADALRNAVETSHPQLEHAGHQFTCVVPPEPIFVDGDEVRLSQVFANLLNNAAKYTARGGRVDVRVERQDQHVVVTVADNGVGIPAEMLPRVFDMFTQVDRSLERAQGGLGIGLNIVQRLVEMHGGTVSAHSAGHGHGSRFVVRLPVAGAEVAAVAVAAHEVGARPAARRKILVVDDNRDSATSLAAMLAMMGNETRSACDGIEAIEVAASFVPDVILLDIGMPRLNGYEACRRLRMRAELQHVVIVACTGWGQEDDKKTAAAAGFNFHLTKPVDPAALEKLLAGVQVSAG